MYHVVDHSYAHVVHVLPASRTVVTCHDADAFLGLVAPHLTRSKLPKILARRVLSGMQKAAVVACDSAATRDELLAYDLVGAEQAVVVHNGVDQAFTGVPSDTSDRADRFLHRQFAWSGRPAARRHVHTAQADRSAARRVRRGEGPRSARPAAEGRRPPDRRAAGHRGTAGIRDHIVTLPFLAPNQLAALYRRAPRLSFVTSDREGFALPVVEAMACGTSVIATDLPVFREVGGSAIQLAPPDDLHRWRDIVLDTVARHADADARALGSLRNRQQAARFSWATHAQQMTEIYRRLS